MSDFLFREMYCYFYEKKITETLRIIKKNYNISENDLINFLQKATGIQISPVVRYALVYFYNNIENLDSDEEYKEKLNNIFLNRLKENNLR